MFGRDQTQQDRMVKNPSKNKKDSAEDKTANALKAKRSEDARSKKAAKKAAVKAREEQCLEIHEETQAAQDSEAQQIAIDPFQKQLMEMRELLGVMSSKQAELECKVGGHSAKIHALQMRHVATPASPIDVDVEIQVDREIFTPNGKDNLRLLDNALMENYKAKNSNLRVRIVNDASPLILKQAAVVDFVTTFMFSPPACLYVPADRTKFIGILLSMLLIHNINLFAENLTLKIRCLVSLSDHELKTVLLGGTKFWREIEKNFGHKRNRLGANAAREFEVRIFLISCL